jgi:hypothetical protein
MSKLLIKNRASTSSIKNKKNPKIIRRALSIWEIWYEKRLHEKMVEKIKFKFFIKFFIKFT